MRRRRALQIAGGVLSGTFAGCVSTNNIFDNYRYQRDAPVDGPTAWPWRTLAYNSQRTGYTPFGWLPSKPTVDLFALTGMFSELQPALVDGAVYFRTKRFDYENGGGIRLSGLQAIDSKGKGWFLPENDSLASPTVVGNAIFISSDGMTKAFDRRNGELCWEYHEGTGYPTASPAVIGDTVYIGKERLFALSTKTGEVRWGSNHLEGYLRGIAATRGAIFTTVVKEGGGIIYRFDPETGETEWKLATNSPIFVPPVFSNLIFIVEADGWLRALSPADGSEVWSRELDGSSSAMPAVAEGLVYSVATNGNRLAAFDADTGAKRWEFYFGGLSANGPTVAGDSVYLPVSVRDGGKIHVLEAESGTIRSSLTFPQSPTFSPVIGAGSGIIGTGSPSSETRLYLLRPPEIQQD